MTTTLRRGLTGGWIQASVTVDPALNGISALIIWSTKPLNVKSEYKLSRTEMLKTYSCCPADSRLGIKWENQPEEKNDKDASNDQWDAQ